MLILNNKFAIGDRVYLLSDGDRTPRFVVSIRVTPGEALIYTLAAASTESQHWDFEITTSETEVLTH